MKKETTKERTDCQSRSLFVRYGTYLKDTYGAKAYRVAVDGGFSCPNRGRERSTGGCSFCDEFGSRAAYTRDLPVSPVGYIPQRGGMPLAELPSGLAHSIRTQVEDGIAFVVERYHAKIFLLYFQAFSGTWGDPAYLRAVYDFGLSLHDFRELIIATRPDCIDKDIARLLGSYRSDAREVWVELGLQSAHDATLRRVHRGHTVAEFERAFGLLRDAGVKIACHLIFGLPGESKADMMESVDYLSALEPEAVKFHDLHIPTGSDLYAEYLSGELVVPAGKRYVDYLVSAIERLPAETIIMRLNSDTPEQRRAAPRAPIPKRELYSTVEEELSRRNSFQGRLCR